MAATSNESKQRRNNANYTQVKVSVNQEIAAEFKAKCQCAGVSMASEISRFMSGQTPKKATPKVSTRRERRRALDNAIMLLESIVDAEQDYKHNIPINLQNSQRYEAAEHTVSTLEEALNILYNTFEE